MDVHVIDSEEGVGQHGMADDGDSEPNEGGEVNNADNSLSQDEDVIAEPYVGMEFHAEDAAKSFYDEYARRIGFSSKVGLCSHLKPITRDFVCGKEGLKRRSADSCEALLRIQLTDNGKWVVTNFVKEHSHTLVSPSKVHYLRPRRHFAGAAKTLVETYEGLNIVPSGVMYVSMDGHRASADTSSRGIRSTPPLESNRLVKNAGKVNYVVRPVNRRRTLGKDAQNLLDYFNKMQAENPGFFYAIQLDDDNHMANAFWADARSRTAYNHFGDAVTLDTMYRVNQYRVPFAPFTGVNHHGQTILFGCALLLDDSEASFIWLFKTFLTAMNEHQPLSLTTDQDRAIQTAAAQVFPESRHCISKWHVLREGQEKLAHVCHENPNFQVELYNSINLTETIEEFELSWSSILDKYDLRGHDWLRSLYNARVQWVPVYFRDSFFAAMSPNPDCSFFDGYVNQQTTIPMFFRQYERALENWFEREIEADFDTICATPILRTPSPMEKQAANLYTRKIFAKFQEELVETFVYTANRIEGDGTISTFRVAKFEDDHKAYIVTLNYPELRASCSCQMFEYSGILCRHVLTVFTVTNVLTLPSHYILKRWTINAKSRDGIDERNGDLQSQETLTLRYNNLCKEALKFAEEAAISAETYNVALGALKEGGKKVAVVKKNVAKVPPPSSQASSVGYDDRKTSTSASDTTPLLWPRQDEITRRFNLNDAGTTALSVSDLNLPRMAPVSLHRDDGPPETIVVLPCLKSMTWVMENKNSTLGNRVAVINLKLQDYSKTPSTEFEVKFQLSKVTLEPMLRSMSYISEQLSTPANRVAVINLKPIVFQELGTGRTIGFDRGRDGLYYLDPFLTPNSAKSHAHIAQTDNSLRLLHQWH
ncbi:FAR1 domain-containing protein/SWIM domain-containing protein/MULE domain-containing protein [Cephalotus follicularis]|uniref:Protein FAR1-RELATED SEQUENCE n=1 Tax=Cephalotus follicularis TaxID=3775 RepID=A0A1Q3D3J9_CEPFO|nr:FAR1 domain-containing protein/SWIM domain-containing protein/MULE domain-containing protein [Cephalotus follicularis]